MKSTTPNPTPRALQKLEESFRTAATEEQVLTNKGQLIQAILTLYQDANPLKAKSTEMPYTPRQNENTSIQKLTQKVSFFAPSEDETISLTTKRGAAIGCGFLAISTFFAAPFIPAVAYPYVLGSFVPEAISAIFCCCLANNSVNTAIEEANEAFLKLKEQILSDKNDDCSLATFVAAYAFSAAVKALSKHQEFNGLYLGIKAFKKTLDTLSGKNDPDSEFQARLKAWAEANTRYGYTEDDRKIVLGFMQ